MINEEMNKVMETVSDNYAGTLLDEHAPEKQGQEHRAKPDKPHTEELSKEEKRLEKLSALKEKYEKALSAKVAAEKKTDSISAQIAKIENELHAEEDNRLMAACRKKNITYAELADFVSKLPENRKLNELL